MKEKKVLLLISILALASFLISPLQSSSDSSPALVIYTYDSLLADPGFDFAKAFEEYKGLPAGSVQVVNFSDANAILINADLEKTDPTVDVLIGLDNVLAIQAFKDNDLLLPYESPSLQYIPSELVGALDPQYRLLPYDYGIISFFYDENRIGDVLNPITHNITLDYLIDHPDLLKKLVIESPLTSSPGLGFLLWTIGVFGDPKVNLKGVLNNRDWRDWWEKALPYLRVVPSWGEAFNLFFSEEADKPIMISYGTSPAYGACLYNDTSTEAFVSHENGKSWAWFQVEGIGIMKNSKHVELAKEFVDWFLSADLQQHIPTNQWMYPANAFVTPPNCFLQNVIAPNETELLNDIITRPLLEQHLDYWLDEWEDLVIGNTGAQEGTETTGNTTKALLSLPLTWQYFVIFGALLPVIRRKHKKH